MKFTPLFAAEVQMMTPPRHQPRRSGRIRGSFRYSADDVRCKDCTRYDSGHPCHLNECVCLEERIEAGVVELNTLARECFGGRMFRPLQRRLRDELKRQPFRFFLSDAHRGRWTHWKNRCCGMSGRNAAALFLLTADEELWQRVLWHFDSSGFDFSAIRISGIHPELYSIYQAAKTISVGGDNIVISCVEGIFKKYVSLARKRHPNLFRAKSYSPHSMRHSTATHMLEAGVPLIVIKNFLGHSSLQTTQVYAAVSQCTLNKHIQDWNKKWFSDDGSLEHQLKAEIPSFLI